MTHFEPLTTDEENAVREYAVRNGRSWKRELRFAWMDASEPGILQALRNSHGPEWLIRYKLPKPQPKSLRLTPVQATAAVRALYQEGR